MPRFKRVISLKEACLDNICDHMEDFWVNRLDEGVSRVPEGPGPFDRLPGSLVCDLIGKMKRRDRRLDARCLSLIVTATVERLDLEGFDLFPLDHLIRQRCKDMLKELRLPLRHNIPGRRLCALLEALSKLELLGVHWTDDLVLAALGSSCPNLRELDVTKSHRVTDRGIRYLSDEEFSENGDKKRYGKCKLLRSLELWDTGVSELGVGIALRHLPNLRHLHHPAVVVVLGTMHRTEWESGVPITPYNLRSLSAGSLNERCFLSNESDRRSLPLAVDVCPFTSEVRLRINRYTTYPEDLVCLSRLDGLNVVQLEVNHWSSKEGTRGVDLFSVGVVSVLRTRGQCITSLSITRFPAGVDVGVIGTCCPLLEQLTLHWNEGYVDTLGFDRRASVAGQRLFGRLKVLQVKRDLGVGRDGASGDIPPLHLEGALCSPVLETLCVEGSNELDDKLLGAVLRRGQDFSCLGQLVLIGCDRLTMEFVDSVIRLSGPLEHLAVKYCRGISQSDWNNSFYSSIGKNDWGLRFEFSACH